MKIKPKISWFLTPTGRNFSLAAITTASVSCVAAKFLPHTIFLDKYQEIVTSYRDGLPLPVSPGVQDRFKKVLQVLKIPERDEKFLKPFTVFGFDIFSAGTVYSKWGAIIGIPESFSYISKDTIDKRRIEINNEPVDWTSEPAQNLLNALVLSENAQMYALAREVEEKRSFKILLDTSYPPLIIFAMYSLGQYYNNKLNFYNRPRSLRVMFYSLLTLFGVGLYCFLKDFTQVHYETQTDKILTDIDPLFVYGGLEYYQKIIERNKALRKLLGAHGQQLYSVHGNENFFIRQKRLPLNVRKLYFETKLSDLNNVQK